ncbi:hypothetical protein FPOAC2_09898 [Fusarium poae]|uniref:hypothetical protein n=1 Tax=Fusarium poae TaxID=36050 RepID=UPI001CE9A221|nr:hypothetical protein FPOAC1_009956 [Fusarium poae]KAG8670534.1 hypothetical protein FPOAC1_009956 [Fusarium poae]
MRLVSLVAVVGDVLIPAASARPANCRPQRPTTTSAAGVETSSTDTTLATSSQTTNVIETTATSDLTSELVTTTLGLTSEVETIITQSTLDTTTLITTATTITETSAGEISAREPTSTETSSAGTATITTTTLATTTAATTRVSETITDTQTTDQTTSAEATTINADATTVDQTTDYTTTLETTNTDETTTAGVTTTTGMTPAADTTTTTEIPTTTMAAPEPTKALLNGGFEDATNGPWTFLSGQITNDPSLAHSGSKFAQLDVQNQQAQGQIRVEQLTSTSNTKRYTLSFYATVLSTPNMKPGNSCQIYPFQDNSSFNGQGLPLDFSALNTYTHFTYSFTPINNNFVLKLGISCSRGMATTFSVAIDDVSIVEVV